jgi:hypothetical protein
VSVVPSSSIVSARIETDISMRDKLINV